ncbi:MAG: DUF2887 domain-containing protein [Armatimonadetes bacterium]|nr:DUF2887 domain-containing protein [Armatimonadota bacterium]
MDGVFIPDPEYANRPIYFVEVRFQKDPLLYARMCAEAFLYLYQNAVADDWKGVVIYPDRRVEPAVHPGYRELIDIGKIRRIFIADLGEPAPSSPGIGMVNLVTAP